MVRMNNLNRLAAPGGILAVLIVLRFFDEDFSFIVKGVVFILLGAGFLAANLILVHRMRVEEKQA